MISARARWIVASAVATAAAAALALPARAFGALTLRCDAPPQGAWAATLIPIVLAMTIAWALGVSAAAAERPSLPRVIGGILAPHLVALTTPPFLSRDTLFYAAIGRVLWRYHADPYVNVHLTMAHDDPFWRALPHPWRYGTSAYLPGFHLVCRAVAAIAGDDLRLALFLHRALALGALGLTAWIAGAAAEAAMRSGFAFPEPARRLLGNPERARAVVLALVGLCPVAILEASSSGHNDVWLALALSAGAYFVVRARPIAASMAALTAALVKPSGVVVACVFLVSVVAAEVRARRAVSRRAIAVMAVAMGAAAVAVAALALPLLRRVTQVFDLSGSPFVTARSLEAAPRIVLSALGAGGASDAIGLGVRAAGLVVLAWAAVRALAEGRVLPRLGPALFAFFLFFSGWSQDWYLLVVLPLLPFADARWLRAIAATMACYPLTYAISLRYDCGYPPGWSTWAFATFCEGLLANGPAIALFAIDRRR